MSSFANSEGPDEMRHNAEFHQSTLLGKYSKTCLKRPLKKKTKIVFKTDYRLMQVNSAILSTFIKL